jgi:hypothetical protein
MLYPTSISNSDRKRPVDASVEDRAQSFVTGVALRRMLGIALTLLLTAALSYAIPSFQRVRPWVSGEGVPVLRLFFGEEPSAEIPDFQGGAIVTVGPPQIAPPPDPTPSKERPAGSGVHISPDEYADLRVPLENTAALASFYEALRRSALKQEKAITRVAHYGDSSVAADEISWTARRKLQTRFGDSGHGFMLTAKGTMFYGHKDIAHRESDGWQNLTIVRRSVRNGHYGYGGIVAVGQSGDYTQFGTVESGPIGRNVSRFEVFFQRHPSGGELRLSVDGKDVKTLNTHAEDVEDAFELIQVPDGSHTLTLRAKGEIRMYGVSLERETPGVVYDALGMVGARADRLLDANPEHIAEQIAHRDPDLLVLGFGGNEAGNDWLDPVRYQRDLIKVVKLMRSGKPEMACLMFGPLDQGERNARGDVVTLRSLPMIVEVQRRVAMSQGCAFYDTFATMGGPGSVGRWYRMRPRLFSPDFRHATPEGYSRIGAAYYQALLRGFAEYLAQH